MYQLADVFTKTKALSSAKFAPLRSKLRVVPPLQLEGAVGAERHSTNRRGGSRERSRSRMDDNKRGRSRDKKMDREKETSKGKVQVGAVADSSPVSTSNSFYALEMDDNIPIPTQQS
ncbi:hypothetical protein COLO4_03946 [Corchorus olitorius]|uniref:Uncharacterized protein n=1 Tax=Corchorus olitorius TaxID=93759 RepID=A0A1R3KVX4_9ROSI|nr:hypothetical protein COLO4_03946 [Corchorus olitorius]